MLLVATFLGTLYLYIKLYIIIYIYYLLSFNIFDQSKIFYRYYR